MTTMGEDNDGKFTARRLRSRELQSLQEARIDVYLELQFLTEDVATLLESSGAADQPPVVTLCACVENQVRP